MQSKKLHKSKSLIQNTKEDLFKCYHVCTSKRWWKNLNYKIRWCEHPKICCWFSSPPCYHDLLKYLAIIKNVVLTVSFLLKSSLYYFAKRLFKLMWILIAINSIHWYGHFINHTKNKWNYNMEWNITIPSSTQMSWILIFLENV